MSYRELHQKSIDWEYEVRDIIACFPRAWKLMRKHKPFLVVACDEPYYLEVYRMIKEHEIEIGRWTDEDEKFYQLALQKLDER